MFVSTGCNYKLYANIGLAYTCEHRLMTKRNTGAGPNFKSKNELPIRFEIPIPNRPLPNVCNANKISVRMLGIINLQIHVGHTRDTIQFIVCETLAASAIIGSDFCDKHLKAIWPKLKLEELDSGNCILIVRKHESV